ncbi:MAG TPA: cell division protein FtsX [Peptococcaceae bacterium]|nr:cell division protein FtsX [Peptococcaceae bacterium]
MRLSSLGYVARDGFRNIWRNKIMSIASISTVAISLFLLGCVWLFVANVNNMVFNVESELEINAYVEQDLPRETAQALASEIGAYDGVASVEFIPKEEGILMLENRFGTEADLAGTVGENNPLPDMIQLKATNPDLVPVLAEKLTAMEGIDQVRYGQGMVEKLLKTADWLERAGFIGLICISIAAIFLISTSIRVTVFARRDEITIMRLVGATNWYIRWPFLIEGMLTGFFGALLAVAILVLGYNKLVISLMTNMSFIPIMTDQATLLLLGRNILLYGAGLGIVGSFLSVFRYLRV